MTGRKTMRSKTRLALVLLLAAFACAQDFQGVQRIVAIGDLHGDYDRMVALLRTAKLIDSHNAWSGGAAHLVLNGDFIDRGPASRKVMDLAMALQEQAVQSGGAVHALIGNHEVMNIIGDLRYLSKGDWASYRTPESKNVLDHFALSALDDLKATGKPPRSDKAFLDDYKSNHDPAWAEQRYLFTPAGKYGRWLRQQPVIIRINDSVFMHAGIPPRYASATREEINRHVIAEFDDAEMRKDGYITTEDGPLWYRDLVGAPESQAGLMAAHVDRILRAQQAQRIVVGHSQVSAIIPLFGGKVIAIDVGLSSLYKGPPAFLLIEDSKLYAIHRGARLNLPTNGGVVEYLRDVAAIDPGNRQLRSLLARIAR